ncbi:MAG: hypothetical protein H0V82_02365 [Candidatus Protochlamydia sp.]|nr:hypothetical protein [Candidatus Protochlamydia sp.]
MAIRRPLQRPSDSLARCDPHAYSNLYDVNKKVDIRVANAGATQPINKDTLEISKEKLTKDAMNRLRHTSKYTIFQTGFMRVGKYLFLAVAFPPYFLLFGIPKWILVQGLPALMTICTAAAEKVKKKIKKRTDAVKQRIAQAVLSIQQTLHRLLLPIIRLGLDIYNAFHRMRQKASSYMLRMRNKAKVFLRVDLKIKKAARNIKEKIKNSYTRLQERKIKIQARLAVQLHTTVQLMRVCQQWIVQLPEWGTAQFGKIARTSRTLKEKWKGKFNISQKAAEKSMEWLTKQKQQAVRSIKLAIVPVQQYYQNNIKPLLVATSAYLKDKKKKGADFFNHKRNQFLQILHDGQEKLKNMTFQHASEWLIRTSGFSRFPSYLQWALKKLIGNSLVLFMLRNGFKIVSNMARFYLFGLSFIILNLSKISHVLSKGIKLLKISAKTFFRQVLNIMTSCLHAFERVLKKGLYLFLLACIMLSIIFAWGLKLLGKLMQKGLKRSFSNS